MWNDAVVAAAKKYPNSKFVLVDTEISEAQTNVISILFSVDEAAYPLGFLSAWWADKQGAENPATCYVGALEIPQIMQFAEPFGNGVISYNEKYEKNVAHFGAYAGDFFNADLGKHLADSLVLLGAEVIFGVGSETGNGALLKAKELGKVGIGVDVDQYISFPEVSDILLSSAMKGLGNAIYAVVKSFNNDGFTGGVYLGNLSNEGVGIASYHDFENQIPDSIKLEIEKIKTGIIDGSISTGWQTGSITVRVPHIYRRDPFGKTSDVNQMRSALFWMTRLVKSTVFLCHNPLYLINTRFCKPSNPRHHRKENQNPLHRIFVNW